MKSLTRWLMFFYQANGPNGGVSGPTTLNWEFYFNQDVTNSGQNFIDNSNQFKAMTQALWSNTVHRDRGLGTEWYESRPLSWLRTPKFQCRLNNFVTYHDINPDQRVQYFISLNCEKFQKVISQSQRQMYLDQACRPYWGESGPKPFNCIFNLDLVY